MKEDSEDWEDDNFKVIQGVKHIKTRCGLIMADDDEQDADMEQIIKKTRICVVNEKNEKQLIKHNHCISGLDFFLYNIKWPFLYFRLNI